MNINDLYMVNFPVLSLPGRSREALGGTPAVPAVAVPVAAGRCGMPCAARFARKACGCGGLWGEICTQS